MARNIYINGEEEVISAKLHVQRRTNSSTFAARFSGVFADVEVPDDEVGNNKKLSRMQCTRSVAVSGLGYCSCLTGFTAIS